MSRISQRAQASRWIGLALGMLVALAMLQLPAVDAQLAPSLQDPDAQTDAETDTDADLTDPTDPTDPTLNDIVAALDRNGSVSLSVELGRATAATLARERDGFLAGLPPDIEVLAATESVPSLSVHIETVDELRALWTSPLATSVVLAPSANLAWPAQRDRAQLNVARPAVGADQMHQTNVKGEGLTIAMIDSGVDALHPDLRSAVTFEWCQLPAGPDRCPNGTGAQTGPGAAADDVGHGTNVAGVLVSDGIVAPVGIAPGAQLEVYKVGGPAGPDLNATLLALDFILTNRPDVDVINVSIASDAAFAGPCQRSVWPAFFDIVAALRDRGTLVIAPSGNQFLSGQSAFPACLNRVVAVAGTTTLETLLPASNIDSTTDIAAPSQNLVTTGVGATTQSVTGTSFAAPIVSACIALMMQDDDATASQGVNRLQSGVLQSSRNEFTVPWINCAPRCNGSAATVNLALGQAPTSGDDVILGTGADDEIISGQGNDIICGLDGQDRIVAGLGDDIVFGGRHDDTVFGGPGDDVINGQRGHDRIRGGDGNDRLYGSWGHDWIWGDLGDDRIIAKAGRDVIDGGDGNDFVRGGIGSDQVAGGAGNDVLFLETGSDQATGGTGDDRLVGGGGWDLLDGGDGNDECAGDRGIDQAANCEATTGVP